MFNFKHVRTQIVREEGWGVAVGNPAIGKGVAVGNLAAGEGR